MIKYLVIILCLGACSKTDPTTALIKTTQESIKATQETIKNLDKVIAPECKTTAINSIISDVITRLSNLSKEVENIGPTCELQKDVLNEEISKLQVIIASLVLLVLGLGYALFKGRKSN